MSDLTRRRLLLAAGSGFLSSFWLNEAALAQGQAPAREAGKAIAGAAKGGTAPKPLKIGFVYDARMEGYGGSARHAQSAAFLKKRLGNKVQLVPAEQVAEGQDADRVLRQMCADGCSLIFGTAYGFMDPIIRVARDFPGVHFESHAGFKTADNVGTYNARFYEARYLAGMLAAHASKQGVLAYVAPVPVAEVLQGINAYTLGARAVNPKATVRVIWTNSWRDPARERDAAYTLLSQKADVFTHHTDTVAVAEVARDRKLKFIGFQANYAKLLPSGLLLGSVLPDWDAYYLNRTQAVLNGSWAADRTWGGLKDGMVNLDVVSGNVSQAVRRQLAQVRQQLIKGERHVFGGVIRGNDGTVRQLAGTLSDDALQRMNWLVEGVIGRIS
ncbi:MAG: BMP family ABC transporter substrate-binding protein [Lautropia sp.]|nr:BMP family ABC transporter substrate-binding protein [Lautropia sp.]